MADHEHYDIAHCTKCKKGKSQLLLIFDNLVLFHFVFLRSSVLGWNNRLIGHRWSLMLLIHHLDTQFHMLAGHWSPLHSWPHLTLHAACSE